MDVIWYLLERLTSGIGNDYRFRNMFKLAKIVLITRHSNAGIERVYSLVSENKNEGSDRNRLDIDSPLSSILAVKLDRPEADSANAMIISPARNFLQLQKQQQGDIMLNINFIASLLHLLIGVRG